MTLLQPFRAYLPDPELAAQVVAPPLAALPEWDEYTAANPMSFLPVLRGAIDSIGSGPDDEAFTASRAAFEALVASRHLVALSESTYYVLRITNEAGAATGVIALVALDAYRQDRIKRHEKTLARVEDHLVTHLQRVRVDADPIVLAHRELPEVAELIAGVIAGTPLLDFEADDGRHHELWAANARDAAALAAAYETLGNLYIVDGHHRAAAADRFDDGIDPARSSFLAALFPDTDLTVWPYHRCVTDLGGMATPDLLEAASKAFDVAELAAWAPDEAAPRRRGEIGMLVGSEWFRLQVRPELVPDDAYGGLDVVLLHDLLLQPHLGIGDPSVDPRLRFVGGASGLSALEAQEDCAAAFAMYPPSARDVMAIADAGLVMPPKSTWFEPKIRAGLVVRAID